MRKYSRLPLSYCTNVHPGRTLREVRSGLEEYTLPVREQLGRPIAAGLWLARSVVDELLAEEGTLPRFAEWMHEQNLPCYSLNAFPYGDFHSERVKEKVYLPDWASSERLEYTQMCAQALSVLLAEHDEGSLSSVPLGFAALQGPEMQQACIENLRTLARFLDRLAEETGRVIRLALEPEPLCILERTDQVVAFFEALRDAAAGRAERGRLEQFIGVCYDVCHQAVEFEDVSVSIRTLQEAGIRLNKIHITCALQLDDPADEQARAALAEYAEPRYLHQTFAQCRDGTLRHVTDLTGEFALRPPREFLEAICWRVHFHVPVNVERLGPLRTTRPELLRALATVGELPYQPHLEVETYTWSVLRGEAPATLVDGLTAELAATYQSLQALCEGAPESAEPCP